MNLFKKDKEEKEKSDDFYDVIASEGVKTGQIKIYRMKREKTGRQGRTTRRYEYFVAVRSLRDLDGDPIEEFISSEYGGGEYIVKLYKIVNGIHSLIQSFTYLISGAEMDDSDEDPKEDLKDDPFRQIALRAAENQLLGNNIAPASQYPPQANNSNTEMVEILKILLTNTINNSRESLGDKIDDLMKLKELVGGGVPVVQPESETSKLIDAGAQVVSALLTAKLGGSTNAMQSLMAVKPNLAEIPLPTSSPTSPIPNAPTIKQPMYDIPDNPPENINGNGHKPVINMTQAFEMIYLKRFKETALEDAPEHELAAMIESMAVNTMFWFEESEYHPIIKDFAEGYADMDLAKLGKGFNDLMQYAQIAEDKAGRIKALLISIYQDRYSTKEQPDANNQDGESVNA